jgi:hypothetical protein
MAQQNILAGSPPIVWSTIEEAFIKINANFTELYTSIGGMGSGIDFTDLETDLIPNATETYDLGSPTKRWRDLYLSGDSIYLGIAQISADLAGVVDLPAGSRVGGDLIRNPAEASFSTIAVAGQDDVIPSAFADILTLIEGTGIDITTDDTARSVTVTNSGVVSLATGTGIAVSSATGAVTLTNTGVTQVTGGTGISTDLATGSITLTNTGVTSLIAGSGIILDTSTGAVTVTNSAPNIAQNVYRFLAVPGQTTLDPAGPTSTLTISPGYGLDITTNIITNTLSFGINERIDIKGSVFADDSSLIVNSVDNSISTNNITVLTSIKSSGNIQSDLYTNQTGDTTLTIQGQTGTVQLSISGSTESGATSGGAIGISGGENSTNAAAGGAVTISGGVGNGGGSLTLLGGNGRGGGIGGDTILAGGANIDGSNDGGNLYVRGGRDLVGGNSHGSVYIGDQYTSTVFIYRAEVDGVFTGEFKGSLFAEDSSIIVNTTNNSITINNLSVNNGINSITALDTGNLQIVSTNKVQIQGAASAQVELGTGASGAVTIGNGSNNISLNGPVFVSLLDTSDSSAMTFVPAVTFNSDVSIENELRIQGSRVINLAELKLIVAASSSFADFQTRIAALS